jgi:hypothetical protein
MKYLSIQLLPERENSLDKEFVILKLQNKGYVVEVYEGEENGKYINLNIKTDNLKNTWDNIKDIILKNQTIHNSSIVVCEGNQGWDDYLLLHHFDKNENIDEL